MKLLLIQLRNYAFLFTTLTLSFASPHFFLSSFAEGTPAGTDSRRATLKSLPYLSHTAVPKKDRKKAGVTIFDHQAAYPGLNFYCSEDGAGGYFLDLSGNVVHTLSDRRPEPAKWKLIEPYGKVRFLVLCERTSITLMERDSSIVWNREGPFHHDLAVVPDGSLYALTRQRVLYPALIPDQPIIDHYIVHLDREGKTLSTLSIADLVAHDPELLATFNRQTGWKYLKDEDALDVFHANTIEVIEQNVAADGIKICQPGDILFSVRNLDLIGFLDPATKKVRWRWGPGELDLPHAPTLLDNGNILIFDNGTHRGYSRVIELDPRTGKIVWEHQGKPPDSFFSPSRGFAQRLPNGNTLITDSDHGRAFEVTPGGKMVWEFYNPRIDREHNYRATIYRFQRLIGAKTEESKASPHTSPIDNTIGPDSIHPAEQPLSE